MRKPSVKRGPASCYERDGERIVEISHQVGGCLMSVRVIGDSIRIELYRIDDRVSVIVDGVGAVL